jgi:hypothetical protein
MKATELISKLQAHHQRNLDDGYDDPVARQAAAQCLVYEALYDAQQGESLHDHSYWNTDTDYYVDFYTLPSAGTVRRLYEAAALLLEVVGVTVHFNDFSMQ